MPFIGRDVLSRLLYGARVSLAVGFAATTLSVVVSLLVGGVAGFVGGKLYWRCSAWWTPGCRSRACCCC